MPHFLLRDTLLSDRRLPLPGRVVVLGRSMESDVPIPHESVSRRHALLEETDDGYMISDLGSSHGTFVGERRVVGGERLPVPVGSYFRIGKISVLLAQDEAIEEGLRLASPPAAPPPPEPRAMTAGPAPARGSPSSRPPRKRGGGAASKDREERPRRRPKEREGKPRSAAAQRRTAQLRKRRSTFRWAGIGVTVVLLALAAYFVYKIAAQSSEKSAAEAEEKPGRSSSR